MQYETKTKRRVNVILPVATINQLDEASEQGERSQLIDRAVRWYLREAARSKLHRDLKAGAEASGRRDLKMSRDWFAVENTI